MLKFGPMYIHFKEHCLIGFDTDTHYGVGNGFNCQRIEMQKDTKVKLNKGEVDMLKPPGITFKQ